MSEPNHHQDAILDEALNGYPVASLPPAFVNQVMARVASLPQAQRQPQFKLQFLDVALPAFLAGFASLVLVIVLGSTGKLDVAWLPNLQLELATAGPRVTTVATWLGVGGMVVLIEVALVVFVCAQLWLDRPYPVINQS